jgi:hypothetical protein
LKLTRRVLGYLIIAFLLSVIAYSLVKSWREMDVSQFTFDARYLAASFIPHAVGLALAALGWGLIIRRLDCESSLLKSAKIYYYANVPKNLPGTFWYIIGRVYLHEREGVTKTISTIAIALELVLSILASAVVYMVCLLLRPGSSVIDWRYIFLVFLGGAALLHPAVFNRGVNRLINLLSRQQGIKVTLRFQDICLWLALYIVIIGIGGGVLFLLVNAVYPTSLDRLPLITRAWAISVILSSLAFWIPVRLGIRDGILVVALSAFLPISAAVLIALLWRVWIALGEIFWALVATRF